MRCKLGDRVIVIKGVASGAVGTIMDKASLFGAMFGGADWSVDFGRPVRCQNMTVFGQVLGEATGRVLDAPDSFLCPLPDDPDAAEVPRRAELAA